MAQSVMTRVIDGTFAGYGLKLAPDSEMPANRSCFVLVLWEGIDMKSVEDLDVFKLAHQLALKTYSTTKTFPSAETFNLVDQMRPGGNPNGLNGAKRLNGWNDWNVCSFIES